MKDQRISFLYVLTIFIAVLFTWLLHEFGHWIAYRLMGFDPYLSFNAVGIRGDKLPNTTQQLLGTAAGPILTLLQAIIIYFILTKKGWNKYLYPFVFIPFYMRLLAGIMNVMSPNDEGFISQHFGLGLFTVSILISLFLFGLVYKISKKFQLTTKFHLITTLLVMLFSSLVILSDQFLRLELV